MDFVRFPDVAVLFHYMKPVRYRLVLQENSSSQAPFAVAFFPYDYVSESYTPSGYDSDSLMYMPGAMFYQEGARNVGS